MSGPLGMLLLEAGEPINHIVFPQSGMVSLLVITKDGDSVETSTIGREGAVGLHRGLGERRSFTRAIVQIAGRFSIIAAQPFQEICNGNIQLRDLIGRHTELLWAEAQQTTACNAIHNASARLCRWLLQCADRVESDDIALTQEFLAQMLAVRRTTVTLLATALQGKGAIKYRRGKISILDRPALEQCACECYHVMHRKMLTAQIGVSP